MPKRQVFGKVLNAWIYKEWPRSILYKELSIYLKNISKKMPKEWVLNKAPKTWIYKG